MQPTNFKPRWSLSSATESHVSAPVAHGVRQNNANEISRIEQDVAPSHGDVCVGRKEEKKGALPVSSKPAPPRATVRQHPVSTDFDEKIPVEPHVRQGLTRATDADLQIICQRYGVWPHELAKAAEQDWPEVRRSRHQIEALARAVATRKLRDRGVRPTSYTQAAVCGHCGPVWLWVGAPEHVAGCPWCGNRVAGLAVPRPVPVTCCDCRHYVPDPIGAGGIGECRQGGDPVGRAPALYPQAPRYCSRFHKRPPSR